MINRKRSISRDTIDKDRYLITYADLITLLLGLFVILYASSSIDEAKYDQLKQAMDEVFKKSGQKVLIEGGDGVLEGKKEGVPDPVFIGLTSGNLNEIENNIRGSLQLLLEKGKLNLEKRGNNLVIDLPEELLFNKAEASIGNEGRIILDTLASLLSDIPNKITVDGHTDSDPIKTNQFKSNWQLSVARAMNVSDKLIKFGLPEPNLSIRGFGSQKPLVKNDNEKNKRLNRRVEITISEIDPTTPSTNAYKN